jgi:hypothetical protein
VRLLIKQVVRGRHRSRKPTPTDLLVWGAALHLAVDWLTQNEWIAANKHQLVHPAGYLHATGHAAAQSLVFPSVHAVALGAAHLVIDTRQPLKLWKKVVSQPEEGAAALSVSIWRDQTAHLVSIAVAALLTNDRSRM